MISKEKQKNIRLLQNKKNRIELGLFLVEWEKSILELLNSDFEIKELFITDFFREKNLEKLKNINYQIIDEKTLEKLSTIKTNNSWIACVFTQKNEELKIEKNELIIVLDTINDPGNLWTIIRICDWYGIKKIIASKKTVELTNPKVISSTMWSISRVKIFYTDLEEYFEENKELNNIYWAFLDWENIHNLENTQKNKWWFIIIWNESHWISKQLEKFITKKITIPSFWDAESLNAWVATGIIIDNFKRKT